MFYPIQHGNIRKGNAAKLSKAKKAFQRHFLILIIGLTFAFWTKSWVPHLARHCTNHDLPGLSNDLIPIVGKWLVLVADVIFDCRTLHKRMCPAMLTRTSRSYFRTANVESWLPLLVHYPRGTGQPRGRVSLAASWVPKRRDKRCSSTKLVTVFDS